VYQPLNLIEWSKLVRAKQKNRVLVVDDEPEIREIITAHIEYLGYEADRADNGRDGFAMLQQNNYDVIISDLMMPELTGMQLLEKVKSYGLDIPFVFLSAFSNSDLSLKALNLGAFDYLKKPFDAGDFRILIREAMRVSKDRQRIRGAIYKIDIPSGESEIKKAEDSRVAEIEIKKIGALQAGVSKSKSGREIDKSGFSKEELLKTKFAEEALPQLDHLESALVNLGQSDNCAWELGYGFRVMGGLLSAARAIKQSKISRLANSFQQVFSYYRVRESSLTTERMVEMREAHKVLYLMVESLRDPMAESGEIEKKAGKVVKLLQEMILDQAS